jgi:hypothetical protein
VSGNILGSSTDPIRGVAYGNGKFVVVGTNSDMDAGKIAYSN